MLEAFATSSTRDSTPPTLPSFFAALFAFAASRAVSSTTKPLSAICRQTSSPIPRLAPVTNATRSDVSDEGRELVIGFKPIKCDAGTYAGRREQSLIISDRNPGFPVRDYNAPYEFWRPSPSLARSSPPQPTGPGTRCRNLNASSELHRDRARATEPRDGGAAG